MPGTSGGIRVGLDFRTGEAEVWEQIAHLAATVTDVGQKFYIQQAEVQLQDSILQAEDEMLNLNNRLRENQDEETYQNELSKSIKTMQRFRPKNGMAARGYDSWIKSQTPGWRGDVEKSRQIRIDNKWFATLDDLADKAKDNGSTAQVKIHVATGLALGIIDENTAGDVLRKIENDAEYNQGLNWALTNPQGLLDSIKVKDGKTYLEGYSTLTSGQIIALRSNAEGTLNFRERQKDEATSALYDDILRHAAEGTTPERMKELLRQTVGISDSEKTKLLKSYMAAHSLWSEKGIDPYNNTQDFPALTQSMLAIEDGRVKNRREIDVAWLSGKNGMPRWSFYHNQWLKNLWESYQKSSGSEYSPSHSLAKQYFGSLEMLYWDKEGNFKNELLSEYHANRLKLEAALKEYWNSPAEMAKHYNMIVEHRKKENAKKTVSKFWRIILPKRKGYVAIKGEISGE